jgi:hypothetical protein
MMTHAKQVSRTYGYDTLTLESLATTDKFYLGQGFLKTSIGNACDADPPSKEIKSYGKYGDPKQVSTQMTACTKQKPSEAARLIQTEFRRVQGNQRLLIIKYEKLLNDVKTGKTPDEFHQYWEGKKEMDSDFYKRRLKELKDKEKKKK